MEKGVQMRIKEILGSANKTVIENIVGVVAKVRKPIVNKPGSKDATRQGIVVKDATGATLFIRP